MTFKLYTICCSGAGQKATRDAWGFVVTPDSYSPKRMDGRDLIIDAATWAAYQQQRDWDEAAYKRMLPRLPWGDVRGLILPDVVMDAAATEARSEAWYAELKGAAPLLYAVQQGYDPDTVKKWLRRGCGIFIGGDRDFKISAAPELCRMAGGAPVHMGRVNSAVRLRAALSAGCTSTDGASPVRFPPTRVELERVAAEVGVLQINRRGTQMRLA